MGMTIWSIGVTTTGSAGSATGSDTLVIPVCGYLEWVYLDYHASAPGGTTDVTISDAHTPPNRTLLTVSNNATDGCYVARSPAVNASNSAITNSSEKWAITGDLTVSVAQSNALTDCVTAYVCVSD